MSLEGGSLGGEIVQGTIKIHPPPPAVLICFHEIDHSSLIQSSEKDNHLTGCLENTEVWRGKVTSPRSHTW